MVSLLNFKNPWILFGFTLSFCVTPAIAQEVKAQGSRLSAQQIKDNDPQKMHPVTPYNWRFSVDGGDQAGGPIRYNTRFPTEATDPNPASYYHSQAFAGLTIEKAFPRGGLQLGVISRRDVAHTHFSGRSIDRDDGSWTVKDMTFHSDAVTLGWVFGTLYRESTWKASLTAVMDRAEVRTTVVNDTSSTEGNGAMALTALSMRSRLAWRILGLGALDMHAGPELHVPIYSRASNTVDSNVEPWLAEQVQLKSSGAVGLNIEAGLRF